MRKLLFVFFLLSSIFALGACPLMTREDVEKENEDKQLKEQVSSIQKQKADSEVRYGDLQNDQRVIAGRIDSIEHTEQVNQQNNRQEFESLKKSIEAQNEKIKMIEQHIDATEIRLMAAIQAGSGSGASSSKSDDGVVAGGKPGKKNDSALFSEAENLFSKKEFKKAVVKYQAYRDKNPKGSKNPEATYKIGICFAEMGLKKDAKEFYQEAIETYPGSPAAKKAKFRLTQMK